MLEAMIGGREQYQLRQFFYAPLHDVAAVRYRHEVLRDLEKPGVLESVRRFAETMRRMRGHLAQADKLHYTLQKQAWFLDAVEIYCQAVSALTEELSGLDVTSRGSLPPHCGRIECFCGKQADTCITQHETAAGHAVAARGGDGAARPVNREPTARREPALESPAFRRVEDVK